MFNFANQDIIKMIHTQIKRAQIIKTDIDTLWEFMSSPNNLKKITPKRMSFNITSKNHNEAIYPGMIITYKVTPILWIRMNWMTEITHVKKNKYFVDEQRIGPYKLWHHEHRFKAVKEGVLVEDIITYVPPLGLLGEIINKIFILNKVNRIFDYRRDMLIKLFKK